MAGAPERDKKPPSMAWLGRRELGAGLTFAASVALFTLGGHWLDGRLSTTPLFLIVGLVIGAVGGFIHLVEAVAPGTLFRRRRRSGVRQDDASDARHSD
jgi:F0F1-type ATP synthase assembly protein I